jgi:hypothetical protein
MVYPEGSSILSISVHCNDQVECPWHVRANGNHGNALDLHEKDAVSGASHFSTDVSRSNKCKLHDTACIDNYACQDVVNMAMHTWQE